MINGHSHQLASVGEDFREMRRAWEGGIDARYRFAERDRFTSFADSQGGTTEDRQIESESDYFAMVERARTLDREDIIAPVVVNRFIYNVLQNGFMCVPTTGDESVDRYLQMRWSDWSNDPAECDATGELSLLSMSQMVLRDTIVAGDVFVPLLNTGRLQLIENMRVKTPTGLTQSVKDRTVFGIELDGSRRRVAAWISEDDIGMRYSPQVAESRRVPMYDDVGNRQLLHIYHPRRSTQTRGITKFAPCGKTAAMHDDVQFAKLVQQKSVSVWTLLRKRGMAFEMPDDVIEADSYEQDPCAPGQTRPLKCTSPGMMYTTYPGEDVEGFSPNVPNPTFFDHARQLQQLIAINLDIPLVILLLDAKETNYSGHRGALEQAKVAFKTFQAWLATKFHQPVYRWKVRSWTTPGSAEFDPFLAGKLAAGVNVFRHDWVFPTWQTTEPLKDTTDRLMRFANNMASLRRIHAEMNQDYDREMIDMVDDRAKLIEYSIKRSNEINAANPDNPFPVSWMQLAANPLPDGFNLNLQTDLTAGEKESVTEDQANDI